MSRQRSGWFRGAALVLIAAAAAAASLPCTAEAQFSVSNQWIYQLDLLSPKDWDALGHTLLSQSVRGSMAIVFPDGRPPITDVAEVESWVTSGKPLRAVCFPGITGDAAAAWSMAKQVGIANARHDRQQQPVLAVNSGWTDWLSGLGHSLELGTLRPAIDSGRAASEPISGRVAELLRLRFAKSSTPVGLVGHSAGGYYTANVAFLMDGRQRKQLRVYNVGLAAQLPPSTPALQLVGTSDTLAQVNSSPQALTAPGTRVVDGLSHLTGRLFRLGDSFSNKPWDIQPLGEIFDRPKLRGGAPLARNVALHSLAAKLDESARAMAEVAAKHRSSIGAKGILSLKLDHDATMLKLGAERATALADLAQARKHNDEPGIADAKRRLQENRVLRRTALLSLQQARPSIPRHMGTDAVDFFAMIANETMASLNPFRTWEKAMQGGIAAIGWGAQWAKVCASNPLLNPWAIWGRPSPPIRPAVGQMPRSPRAR